MHPRIPFFPRIVWIFLLLTLGTLPLGAQVRISEFMAANATGLQDEDGDFTDWIELYNAGGGAVNLAGWHLTDDPADLARWTLPATNLPAGGFLVVHASGKDRTSPRLHASFSLAAGGEYLALVRPDGTTIESEYAPAYPEQYDDVSYGIQTHGSNPTLRAGRAGYLIRRTPGAANLGWPASHPAYADESVAQINISISGSDWNRLMDDPWSETYRPIDLRFRHGDIDVTVSNAGIRCRGNTSREKQPRSFNIGLDAFVPDQTLFGLERLYLNSDVNDPSTARPKILNDLAGALGLPVSRANHVALVVSNTGTRTVFFDALRNNTEAVDDVFLERCFGNKRGNLYKCNNREWPASLTYLGASGADYIGNGTTYELKYVGAGDTSYTDLATFVTLLNETSDADFPHAIMQVFDVDSFLRFLAFDVLTGNWDDYWGNSNNYHLFRHPDTGRWSYIPYDFDNAMGINWIDYDWGTRNIYTWGNFNGNGAPLATRLLDVPEFKKRYSFYMKQMLDTLYSNAQLNPGIFQIRSNLTAALPFETGSVSNMKERERDRYGYDDWPYWSYEQFFYSYVDAQGPWNGNVPNDYGITNFIGVRRASALGQLNLENIAPVLSDFVLAPNLPGTNDTLAVSIRAFDDGDVSSVTFFHSFQGGPTQSVPMVLGPDGVYAAVIPAFGATGTVRYSVSAVDNTGKTTTHPYGGSSRAATLVIDNAALDLIVSELNYNPYDLTPAEIAAGLTDPQTLEFVELFNSGSAPLNLAGFKLQVGIAAVLPAFTLAPGEHAVVVKDADAFRIRYTNTAIRIIGTFSGNLSNSGETLRLDDAQGGVIATITYEDGGDWPGRADGDGSSLELIDAAAGYADPENWRSSSEYGGSPGVAGLGPDNRLVVNEVLSHTDPPLSDSIELFNTTEGAIAIGGWFLSDSKSNYRKYTIPAGTVVPAGGYLVFNETNHFNASGGSNTNDFALDGAHGDDVYLLQADSSGRLVRFVDHVEFGAAPNAEAFGRWPNGSGRLCPMISRTFGASNSGVRIGPVFISELMYHPPSDSPHLEFIEIANPGPATENLANWQLDDGVAFTFSSGILAPGETIVVLSFDPDAAANSALLADFQSAYGVAAGAALAGPYTGTLADGGERIRLLRPDEPPAEEPGYYPLLIEDDVKYDNNAPWPATPDGGGASLERRMPAQWGDDPASWTAAMPPTPGQSGEPVPTFDLTVVCPHGSPVPSAGLHAIAADSFLSNSVPSPAFVGATRYTCTGWTLAGHEPARGATNWMTMVLTNDAVLTWLWDTNHLLAVSSELGGSVQPLGGWHPVGSVVELQASTSNEYFFAGWTGDTNAIVEGNATQAVISVRMDAPVSLTARFESIPPPTNLLIIVSPHGSPSPSVGVHVFLTGATLTNSVPSPVLADATRYTCTGWTLAGHEPASGASNWMTMVLTNDATLTWNWQTHYLLTTSHSEGGNIQTTPAQDWHEPGARVDLEAFASTLYTFAGWSGDTQAIVAGDAASPEITVQIDAPVQLHATFAVEVPIFHVSPTGSHTAPYTDWKTAATSLHAIVEYAPAGATVLVAAATYSLTETLTIGQAMHLISADGPGAAILDGGNAVRPLFLTDAGAVVEGFTIQNGNSGDGSGGGVRIEPAGRLVNCILRHNTTGKSGGGATLIGGGIMRNCLVHDNSALNERGGGLYTFAGNPAPLVENCTFTANSAGDGGGIYLFDAATVRNSIVWGNSAGSGSNLILYGSGHVLQANALDTPPGFADPDGGDFRLAADSPGIDAATNQPWMVEATDLDGRPRIIHSRADLGPYEAILPGWDSDADGLPDTWEWEHSRSLTGMAPDAHDDSDHMTNLQECRAGTDPFDGTSFLGIQEAATVADLPGQFTLRWNSASSRNYRLTYTTNLTDGFPFVASSNIPADPPANSFTGQLAPASPTFYRIELE